MRKTTETWPLSLAIRSTPSLHKGGRRLFPRQPFLETVTGGKGDPLQVLLGPTGRRGGHRRSFPAARWVALWPYECAPGPGRGAREQRRDPAPGGGGAAAGGRCTAASARGLCRRKSFSKLQPSLHSTACPRGWTSPARGAALSTVGERPEVRQSWAVRDLGPVFCSYRQFCSEHLSVYVSGYVCNCVYRINCIFNFIDLANERSDQIIRTLINNCSPPPTLLPPGLLSFLSICQCGRFKRNIASLYFVSFTF